MEFTNFVGTLWVILDSENKNKKESLAAPPFIGLTDEWSAKDKDIDNESSPTLV